MSPPNVERLATCGPSIRPITSLIQGTPRSFSRHCQRMNRTPSSMIPALHAAMVHRRAPLASPSNDAAADCKLRHVPLRAGRSARSLRIASRAPRLLSTARTRRVGFSLSRFRDDFLSMRVTRAMCIDGTSKVKIMACGHSASKLSARKFIFSIAPARARPHRRTAFGISHSCRDHSIHC